MQCDRCGNDNLPCQPLEMPIVDAYRDGVRTYTTLTKQLCLTCVRSLAQWYYAGRPTTPALGRVVREDLSTRYLASGG